MNTPTPTTTLQVLLQHEQDERDRALAARTQSMQRVQQAEDQAAQLLGYRSEYQARWALRFNTGGGTKAIVDCYRSFMQRLDQAVQQQQRSVAQAQVQLQRAAGELLEAERKLAAVRKLIERRGAQARFAAQRREQKHSDEIAQRMHWRAAQHSGAMPFN